MQDYGVGDVLGVVEMTFYPTSAKLATSGVFMEGFRNFRFFYLVSSYSR